MRCLIRYAALLSLSYFASTRALALVLAQTVSYPSLEKLRIPFDFLLLCDMPVYLSNSPVASATNLFELVHLPIMLSRADAGVQSSGRHASASKADL